MKKSVKRFLSTVLAFAMVISCMAIMNVSAFASEETPAVGDVYAWYGKTAEATNNSEVLGVTGASTSTNSFYQSVSSVSVEINGTTYTTSGRTSGISSDVTFTVPSTVTGATLYLVTQSSGSARTVTLKDSLGTQIGNSITVLGNTDPYFTSTSISGLSQGKYTLSVASSSYCIGFLAIEVTAIGAAQATYDYTITGSVDGLADSVTSFTVTNTTTSMDYIADVTGSSYTVKAPAASDPFEGGTFTVNASGYSCDGFTLAEGSGTKDGSGNITYRQNLTFAARKTITDSAYFDASNISASSLSGGEVMDEYFEYYTNNAGVDIGSNTTSYGNLEYSKYIITGGRKRSVEFTTSGPALVQVVFASNSSGKSRACYVGSSSDLAYDSTTDYIATASTNGTLATLTVGLTDSDGGTYYVYSSTDSIQIYSINVVVGATYAGGTDANQSIGSYVKGTDSYILASVADSDLELGDTLTIGGNGTESFDSTNTVYQYVQIGNFVFAGSDVIYSEADDTTYYIYGGKLTDSPANAASLIAENATATIA